ncbi:heterocyst formation ABC transporter subunit HepA [Halomicronema sp. CCY15110]|uniref:heterocyst formation ABC transporter subunit HepA n=1 Tax=Halomicronema sp. CCY15110 TaxID=2767773 RepID=UPI0019519EC3|nr:heterocyst formation ABC transporter subunit HepA [Halomicronema sp. CCY15110]
MSIKPFIFKKSSFWRENYLILRELNSFRGIIVIAIIFTLLSSVFQGLNIGFILTFLQGLTEPDVAPIQTGINWIDIHILGINLSVTDRIYRMSAVLVLASFLQATFTTLSIAYSGLAQSKLVYYLQIRIFENLQNLSLAFFTKSRSGNLINGLTTEVTELKNVFEIVSFMFTRSSILLVYTISILWISWQLTILIVLLFLIISVLTTRLFSIIRELSFQMSAARSAYTSTGIEFINGIRTIQVSAAQDHERQKLGDRIFQVFKADSKTWKIRAVVEPIPETVLTLVALGVLLFSFTVLIPNGQLGTASLLTFLFVLIRTLPIIRQLNNARSRINKYQGAVEATKQLLDINGKPLFQNGYLTYSPLTEGIVFDSVRFGYDEHSLVLKDIDLEIKRGEMTALVGSSGAGKTTLADLIPRFYDPTGGKILVDGIDLKQIEIYSFRRKMAVVSQDTFIFNSSVRDNIAYALSDIAEDKIISAAKMANAWDFIQALPAGLDTHLGDRGVLLSGGQRQRIAIARALLRDPEILILDEATSALDSVTERLVQESIEKLSTGRTVIAIAHRLSTIARADKVVVLEQGRIVEEGSYEELLTSRGKLWQYHSLQS